MVEINIAGETLSFSLDDAQAELSALERLLERDAAAVQAELDIMARALWMQRGRADECPAKAKPTQAALAAFLEDGCPPHARQWADQQAAALFEEPSARWIAKADRLYLEFVAESGRRTAFNAGELMRLLADETDAPAEPLRPLAPIVRAWQERPYPIQAETRKDTRIVPVVRAVESRPERQRGMMFGGLLEGRDPAPELPLFEAAPVRKSVAILDIADASGVPAMAQGRGAPLSARLFVRAGLAVKPEDRHRESVRMAVKVRELRDGLFPNGWQAGRDWPKVREALTGARDYTIRLPDGGRWFMLALRRLPAEDAAGLPDLDDDVVLDLAMPPGATSGPVIDLATLDRLSVESAPRWRAYIAGHALTWEPGKTRRPVPNGRGRFGWSRDPADYPVLTADDRRRLAFGERDSKNRTKGEIDAPWLDLPGLVAVERAIDPKTGEVGWRIMPAAEDADGELPNRGV